MQTDYKLIRQVIEGLSMMNNKFMNLMLDENVSAAQIGTVNSFAQISSDILAEV